MGPSQQASRLRNTRSLHCKYTYVMHVRAHAHKPSQAYTGTQGREKEGAFARSLARSVTRVDGAACLSSGRAKAGERERERNRSSAFHSKRGEAKRRSTLKQSKRSKAAQRKNEAAEGEKNLASE